MSAKPGDTKKKGKTLYRMSSSGKWFKSSNSTAANKQRALNARLDQPAASIPGLGLSSPLTERDVAHQAAAATTVKYGPAEQALAQQLAQSVQQQTNTQGWYQDYQDRLKGYQQQVGAYQQGAQDALKSFQGGVTGLGQADQGYIQGQQQAGTPMGVQPPAAGVQNAGAAQAVREGMVGNFGIGQAQIGAANNTYASTLANVVGPQQGLQALSVKQGQTNAVRKDQATLQREKGAYNQQYRSDKRADEQKNLLAAGALGLNTAKAESDAKIKTASLKQKGKTDAAKLRQSMTSEADRHAVAVANAQTSSDRLAETQRHNRAMEKLRKTNPGKEVKPATGPGSISSAAETKVVSKVNQLTQLMKHSVWPGGPRKGKPMTAEQVRHHYQAQGVDDNIIHLAYSLYKNGGKVGPDGVRAAHALGIHVGGRWGQAKKKQLTSGQQAAKHVPGVGGTVAY